MYTIDQEDTLRRAEILYSKLHFGNKEVLNIYGVPRGGVPVTYLLLNVSNVFRLGKLHIVSNPNLADYIIDDLLDSGETKAVFNSNFPDTPFMTLVDKQEENIKEWVLFPWEDTIISSAGDIPTRLLQFIGEDTSRGGLIETPKRFLKAWKHYSSGYGKDPKDILKEFTDGAEAYNEMVLVKDIPVYSHCEHHLAPFYGVAHVAYIPNGKIVGLSKLARLVDVFMRRLQVQERLTIQIATTLEEVLEPLGVAVVLECSHSCMIARGVQIQGSITLTSSMHGVFLDKPESRAEFMGLIKG